MDSDAPAESSSTGTPPAGADRGAQLAGDPRSWVDEHGDALFRYALSRLGDRDTAEDLVQETFLAALEARKRFRGASAPRTWLTSVLRHKLVDHLRRAGRQQIVGDPEVFESGLEQAFDARGRWVQRPGRWAPAAPAGELERREFQSALQACTEGLTGRAGEAFALRVLCELSADDVCKVLEVKPTNLWVLLHRARSRLRTCLERTWFGRGTRDEPQC